MLRRCAGWLVFREETIRANWSLERMIGQGLGHDPDDDGPPGLVDEEEEWQRQAELTVTQADRGISSPNIWAHTHEYYMFSITNL